MKIRIHKRSNGHGQERWVVDWTSVSGRRERRYFVCKKEAEAEAAALALQRSQTGDVWLGLTAEQRNEIIGVFSEAAAVGRSLKEVWRGFQLHAAHGRAAEVHVEAKPPVILTVRQAARVLLHMKRRHPRGLAWFALALMAGIRPEACDRLSWHDVELDRGIVTVDAAASKVRQRRIVHLQPAAVAWLQLARRIGSELPLPEVARRR